MTARPDYDAAGAFVDEFSERQRTVSPAELAAWVAERSAAVFAATSPRRAARRVGNYGGEGRHDQTKDRRIAMRSVLPDDETGGVPERDVAVVDDEPVVVINAAAVAELVRLSPRSLPAVGVPCGCSVDVLCPQHAEVVYGSRYTPDPPAPCTACGSPTRRRTRGGLALHVTCEIRGGQ